MKYVMLATLALAFSVSHAEDKQIIRTNFVAHDAKIVSVTGEGVDAVVKFKTGGQTKEITAIICKDYQPFDVLSTIATIKLGTATILGSPPVELQFVAMDGHTLCIASAAVSIK